MTKTISEGYQISNSPDNYSVVFVSKKDFPKLKKLYKKMAGMETVSMIDLKDMSDTLCCSL